MANEDENKLQITPSDQTKEILQRIVRHKRKVNEEWVTIIDQNTLERSILLFCQQHFQQAANTPCGSGHLSHLLEASGLTEAAKTILQGTFPTTPSMSKELKEFLTRLAIPEKLQNVDPIPINVSVQEYSKVIKCWDEQTSTSPLGRHLGFYKAIMALPSVNADMCTMLNIVSSCGMVPKRWCNAISVLLEKRPRETKCKQVTYNPFV